MKKINLLVVLCGFMSVGSIGCMEDPNDLSDRAMLRDFYIQEAEDAKKEENNRQRAVVNEGIESGVINAYDANKINPELEGRRTTGNLLLGQILLDHNNNESDLLTDKELSADENFHFNENMVIDNNPKKIPRKKYTKKEIDPEIEMKIKAIRASMTKMLNNVKNADLNVTEKRQLLVDIKKQLTNTSSNTTRKINSSKKK